MTPVKATIEEAITEIRATMVVPVTVRHLL